MNKDALKAQIENCKSEKEVLQILKANNINILEDNSKKLGCFSIWLEKNAPHATRIYKSDYLGKFIYQVWE